MSELFGSFTEKRIKYNKDELKEREKLFFSDEVINNI